MEISIYQFALILITIAVVLMSGIYAAKSVNSSESFSLNGRSAGVSLVAGSIAGTCVGGGATVGTAQLASVIGISAWWFTVGTGISLIIMAIFYAKPLRNTSLETISEYLTLNYGENAGKFTSIVSSLGILFSAVASCLPGIYIISAIFNVKDYFAAVILAIFVFVYGFFGGMKSAGIGGIIKMLIIWTSLIIAGSSAFFSFSENPDINLPEFPFFSMFGEGVSNAVANVFALIVGMICTQTYIQAIFSAATPKTAQIGCIVAALITIPVGLPCAIIGIYMHATHPEIAPILVLPTFLLQYQPPITGSIAMGGIILSLIGSIAGLSLGIGTMIADDFLAKIFKIKDSLKLLRVTQFVFLSVILIASAISIFNEGTQVLFWNYLSMALRGGGIFLPLTIAILKPHAIDSKWALMSMIFSTGAAIFASILKSPIHPLFIGLITSTILIILAKYCKQKNLET